MPKRTRDYDESLIEDLSRNPDQAAAYIGAALDEESADAHELLRIAAFGVKLALERMGWQPISEAPKNTEILCWCPDIGVRVLEWRTGCIGLNGSSHEGWHLCGNYPFDGNGYEPTHWQPRPNSPETL